MLLYRYAAKETAKRCYIPWIFVEAAKELPRSIDRLARIGLHLKRLGLIGQTFVRVMAEVVRSVRAMRIASVAHGFSISGFINSQPAGGGRSGVAAGRAGAGFRGITGRGTGSADIV
jgi:hypothetical protein